MRKDQGHWGCHKDIPDGFKDVRDELRMSQDQQKFYGKIKQFDFSVTSLWTHHIHDRCHKDIRDVKDELTDEKYDL